MDNTYIILYRYRNFNKDFRKFKTKYLIIALLKFIFLRSYYDEIKLNFKLGSLFDNLDNEGEEWM